MVSCGLRPQFLASGHVLPLYGGGLATSWLQGGRNSAPSPSDLFLRLSQSWEEVKGGPVITFACIDHFCPGLTQTASPPTHAQT